jgi:uncharacterized membrane protein
MSDYELRLGVDRAPGEVFAGLRAMTDFPRWSDVILAVEPDGGTSSWTVAFRGGLVRWTQRDTVDEAERRLAFEQVDGDFVALSGEWAVEPGTVTYRVSVRTSVPHLAGAIDPMIGRTLLRGALAVVTAVADGAETQSGGDLLQDPRFERSLP